VPQQWASRDLIPRSNARQRGIHEDEPDDAIRILRGERIPDHVADVMGHDIRLLNAERVEKPGDVAALRLLVVPALRV